MVKFFKELALVLFVIMAGGYGVLLAHSALPGAPRLENIAVVDDAPLRSRWIVTAALAMAQTEVNDYVVYKTARIRLGDVEIHLVALPGTKWMRL